MYRNKTKVTVLLTVKNNAHTIKRCIESILSQSYKNYDIFVVDAFSTDGTYEILKSFGKKIKLHRLHGWAPVAYNWAIKRINSEFIAFIDGDCVADKNWLKELIKGFKSDDILAVAGYYATPKDVSPLQKIIGIELEDRYKYFSTYISQAPTANLCVRMKVAKKLKFDEKLRVSYDADFTYRVARIGKIYYNNKAVVYHYHRSTWKGVFKQQFITATMMPRLYIKHFSKSKGTKISKGSMIIQPISFYLSISCILLSIFTLNNLLMYFGFSLILVVVFIWVYDAIRLSRSFYDIPLFLGFFLCRFLGWILGLPVGVLKLLLG